MLGPGTYANKKRKKPVLKQKKTPGVKDAGKSNPSKRHRDRLNAELDRLLDLLPFSQDVRSGLDKLSVLRLSVGYLRAKGHFTASTSSSSSEGPGVKSQWTTNLSSVGLSEGDLLLQALNGFVLVVSADGLVFYVSSTIKDYLGFSQSDVLHQSVLDLIHTDDRAAFREQLSSHEPQSCGSQEPCGSVTFDSEQLPSENWSFLKRSFVCRFRCLLDNSSGFLALKLTGRLRLLHSTYGGSGNQPLPALFAVAIPVQPPAIVEIRAKLLLYQTKHQLDFTPMGIDNRGESILGYSEEDFLRIGTSGYQFIHAADMMYCADNHLRMMKTGESGLTVFRLLSKSQTWIWVKSNAKLIFKGGRPHFIIAYQKALTNAEGEAYLRQRRLQLPFSTATGEGVLYNTGPTMDITHMKYNKRFGEDIRKDVVPGSLLDCFLSQDEVIYSQTVKTHLPMDQIFMDSRALVSVASSPWEEATVAPEQLVKEEPHETEGEAMESLDRELSALDMGDQALVELEKALHRLGQESQQPGDSEIFDFIDSILFRQREDQGASVDPSCLTVLQDSHMEPLPPSGLQLPDIFTPTIELPELLPECHYPAPNHHQAPPLNHFKSPLPNHLLATPPSLHQTMPPGHLRTPAPPLNHFQAPLHNNPMAPPLNHLKALPKNHHLSPTHLQDTPLNPIQAPPLNPNHSVHLNHSQHNESLPMNPLHAMPSVPLQTAPLNPLHAPGGLAAQCCPTDSVPTLMRCQDIGPADVPLRVPSANYSQWLPNGHEIPLRHLQVQTVHSDPGLQQLGEHFPPNPAGGDPDLGQRSRKGPNYFQWH